jgi:hypothetical protein
MKIAAQDTIKARKGRRPEAVILFTVANQLFAIAAEAVQEIRSTDSLGSALEIEQQEIAKVRNLLCGERMLAFRLTHRASQLGFDAETNSRSHTRGQDRAHDRNFRTLRFAACFHGNGTTMV